MLNTCTVSPPGSIIAPVLFCLHGEIERDLITVDLTYGPSLNLTCSPQNHFCRLYQPTVCRHRLAAEPSYMLTRCAGWNIDICEHSKLYLVLSPTGCSSHSCCAVLVEVDAHLHRIAELQEHKPWARPRSRPGLQWAKPVSDPSQTQIRSGSGLDQIQT